MPSYSTDVQLVGGVLVQKWNTPEEKAAAVARFYQSLSTQASIRTVNNTQPSLYDISRTVSAEGTMVPLCYGECQVGGRVFAMDYDSSTKQWVVGYVIAMGEIEGYTQVWINGEAKKAGVTVTEYTGTTTQTVDTDLSGAISGFNDSMVVTHPQGNYGIAYIVIKYKDSHYDG